MAPSLGSASVDVTADTSTIESGVGGAFKKAAAVAATAFASVGIFNFVQDAVKQASDLNESTNAIKVTLGAAADDFLAFGETAATQLGITQAELNAALVPTAALLKNAGSAGEVLGGQMEQLATRATDVGSIFNADVNEVLDAFGAAMRGETEPIRKFGVSLDDASISAKAVELGLASSTAEVSKAAKTQAAYALVLEQTAQTQGDFANTSDQFANQTKILTAQIDTLKTNLGAPLLAPINEILTNLAPTIESLVPVFEILGKAIGDALTALGPGIGDVVAALVEGLTSIAPAIAPLGQAFSALLSALAPLLPALGTIIGTLLPPLAELLTTVIGAAAPLIELFADFAVTLIQQLMPALTPILDLLGEIFVMIGAQLTSALTLILPMLGDLVVQLLPVIPPLLDILKALLPIIPAVVQLAVIVASLLLPVLTQLAPVLSGVAKVVSVVVRGMVNALVTALNWVLDKVGDALNSLIDVYNNTVARLPKVDSIQKVNFEIQVDTSGLSAAEVAVEEVKIKAVDMSKTITASADAVNQAAGASTKKAADAAAKSAKESAKTIEKATKEAYEGLGDIMDKTSKQTTASLNKAFTEARSDLAVAGLKSLSKNLKAVQVDVVGLAKDRDALTKQVNLAKDALAGLRDERDAFKQDLRDASTGLFNVAIAGQFGSSIELIQKSMANALSATTEFQKLTKQLEARGLGQNLLKQLHAAGPEAGLASARALAAASDAQIKQLAKDDKKLGEQAGALADQASTALFTAGINAAKGLVAGLQSERAAILAEMDSIADALVNRIKSKLKIKSPSQVLEAEVGIPSGQGIAKGLDAAKGSDIQGSMDGIATAMRNGVAGAAGAGGGGTMVEVTVLIDGEEFRGMIRTEAKEITRERSTALASKSKAGAAAAGKVKP